MIINVRDDHNLVRRRLLNEGIEAGADRFGEPTIERASICLACNFSHRRPIGLDVVDRRLAKLPRAAEDVGE